MSRQRLIHVNVCHHGNEENAKNYFIKNLIIFLHILMDVHVKNNYGYSKAQA